MKKKLLSHLEVLVLLQIALDKDMTCFELKKKNPQVFNITIQDLCRVLV